MVSSLITNENEIREIMLQIHAALREKGHNPVNQIVGYILSEDPTYITAKDDARSLICKIDREALLGILLENYLSN